MTSLSAFGLPLMRVMLRPTFVPDLDEDEDRVDRVVGVV